MEKETLKKIIDFLEKEENRKKPFIYKLKFNELITKEELVVDGDLNLMNSYVEELPEGLEVGGNLILVGTEIKSLPEGLVVGGGLYLRGLKIQSLPKGLKVGENLLIYDTPLAKLSETEILNMIEPDGYVMGKIKKE
jgi:hypothetical protein